MNQINKKPMIIKSKFRTIIFFATIILTVSQVSYSQENSNAPSDKQNEVQTIVNYCNFDLSPNWKLANLSFNTVYSFEVNKKGEVIDVEKVRDNFVGEEQVKTCITKWKIIGFPENSRFSVYFIWQHGKGWIRQEVSGNGFMQVITRENLGVEKLIKQKDL